MHAYCMHVYNKDPGILFGAHATCMHYLGGGGGGGDGWLWACIQFRAYDMHFYLEHTYLGLVVGHVDDAFVAKRLAEMGQPYPRVASCAFHHCSSRSEQALHVKCRLCAYVYVYGCVCVRVCVCM